MKLIKQADGKTTIKISQKEWTEIGKEAGFWDNVQQVGKGAVQGVKGAWNAGVGIAGILGNIGQTVSQGIQQLKAKIQQGQVSSQERGEAQQIINGIKADVAAAEQEMTAINSQQQQGGYPQTQQASTKPITLIKKANGKTAIKISENKWQQIGIENGWIEQS
jgi:negative regulator of sigma E activity